MTCLPSTLCLIRMEIMGVARMEEGAGPTTQQASQAGMAKYLTIYIFFTSEDQRTLVQDFLKNNPHVLHINFPRNT